MATYKIDAAHSDILFKVKHLMITNVTGSFKAFDATLTADKEDFSDAQISFTADVNSLDTRSEQRDGHLKSDDFFNAEKFPELKFTSTSITKNGDGYVLKGDLTIRDITKPVELKADYNGAMVDPWGQKKVGFEAEGKIKRDVKLQLNVQFIQQN